MRAVENSVNFLIAKDGVSDTVKGDYFSGLDRHLLSILNLAIVDRITEQDNSQCHS